MTKQALPVVETAGFYKKRNKRGRQPNQLLITNPQDPLPVPQRWPSFAEKQRAWGAAKVTLFPSQTEASKVVVGNRDRTRVVLTMGGERAGKSQWTAYEVFALAPWCDLIYITGAQYENCEPEFRYLEALLRASGMVVDSRRPESGQWSMTTVWGCEIKTLSYARGGSDVLVTTGRAPDLVVMCEAGMLSDDIFLTAMTRIAERRGAVVMSGTLKRSRPWYVALYQQLKGANIYNGASISLPSWENTQVYPGGRTDPAVIQLEAALGDIRFRERIAGEPVPSPLLVFGREFSYDLHVENVDFDPDLPILLACDPGYAGGYALLVVQSPHDQDVRVIDEFYAQYSTWDQAARWLRQRPYIKTDSKGFITNVLRGNAVMDVAGNQHHGDKSQIEQWQASTGIRFIGRKVGIEDGINRLRDFLRSPFDWEETRILISPKCEGLLWELSQGEQYPKDQEGNPIKENPIDANNHSRKALSYLLVFRYGMADGKEARPPQYYGDRLGINKVESVDLAKQDGRLIWRKKRVAAMEGMTFR